MGTEAGPLTDEETAELRRRIEDLALYRDDDGVFRGIYNLEFDEDRREAEAVDAAVNAVPRLLDEVESLKRSLKVTESLRKSADELAEERRTELQRYRSIIDPKTYGSG